MVTFKKTPPDYVFVIALTAVAAAVRVHKISWNNHVVWDEAHFGKFASHYLRHDFYFDVHPPLGKLLCGLSGYLAGYNGSFEFNSGDAYPEGMLYGRMRLFNCLFSIMTVPLAFITSRLLNFSLATCLFIAVTVCFENMSVVLGKFILLDSMLMFFTATTFMCLAKVSSLQRKGKELSISWFSWMLFSGVSIGCVCSVKWVGLFITVVFGLYVILDLWLKYWNSTSKARLLFHWMVRVVTLIIVPAIVYILIFQIHFKTLYKFGKGSSSMTSLFQANQEDTEITVTAPRNVLYGSKVTIRSQGLSPNLLHSHGSVYPEGSGQHQVTTYGFRDSNNDWVIELPRSKYPISQDGKVRHGDVIRLSHPMTRANLHSHDIRGHVSSQFWEVSGYGDENIGDEKDDWVVEIVEQLHSSNETYADLQESYSEFKDLVHPLSTSFRLRHKVLGCYLATTGMSYPSWGFKQGEVICKPSWFVKEKGTWWNVEDHINEATVADQDYTPPKSHFWRDFVLLNYAMMASNNALVPDPDKQDDLASSWWQWPTDIVGLRMGGWGRSQVRYFMMGNPIVVWLSSASILVSVFIILKLALQWQRQILILNSHDLWVFTMGGVFPLLAWVLHFLPFVLMSRVTYVHHYFPALYFAIFQMGFLVEYFTITMNRNWRLVIFVVLQSIVIGAFVFFWPMSDGMTGPLENYSYMNWLKTWRII
ncbi:unnamed protein product [Kuraishia capsulata CBS 1993]|uniref:Dolichyl-phosphate-mannose--protein mannosyltransferase n=1 Tax=Kuraishia capsulata CBS 1993 TaxID=1382522 RepID=W6MMQ4_9ASCO|nr:uncharacterized protein KUCA_T00002218001 [Kuraishia capsulata CBS 1993]CDK26247.1 unnamed protein product [Kuraishia capsulata CBS 1993]